LRGGDPRRRLLWNLAAAAIFGLALVTPFHEVWQHSPREVVPMFPRFEGKLTRARNFWRWIGETETHFVAWQVARNARTLLTRPADLFDTEQCHPTRKMLALGEPMIALGVVGMPFAMLLHDPLVIYNLVLVCVIFLSAMAMYLLVKEWTGLPAAGLVAGLLYAFHPDKIGDINHYYIHDTLWTVLALLFARRLFVRGCWRDALGLSLSCTMQMGGSFYPFVAAAVLAVPFSLWLIWGHGVRHLRIGPCAVAALLMALGAFAVFGPYLETHAGSLLADRTQESVFAVWKGVLPGGARFPGWLAIALAVAAFARGRERALAGIDGDPRWALAAGAVLISMMAISNSSSLVAPPLYAALSSFVPGLDSVRRPNEILSGLYICVFILAGLGCASVLRSIPARFVAAATAVLVLGAYVATLRPASLGLESRVVYRALRLRPPQAEIDFFRVLEERGDSGPLLETPKGSFSVEADRVLLSGYHRRRTSSCVNSLQPEAAEVEQLIEQLPGRAALVRLRDLGFTTIVSHHGPLRRGLSARAAELAKAAEGPNAPLRRIHGIETMTAYEIVAPESRPGRAGTVMGAKTELPSGSTGSH
jgi:hypothetical protein